MNTDTKLNKETLNSISNALLPNEYEKTSVLELLNWKWPENFILQSISVAYSVTTYCAYVRC